MGTLLDLTDKESCKPSSRMLKAMWDHVRTGRNRVSQITPGVVSPLVKTVYPFVSAVQI